VKFSLVTISFNQGRFLEQAIRSVLDQGYVDLEYIVVDPGSTDGSREIIAQYRSRISKIIFEPDAGPADGLNKGFACATGQIFGYLNADDLLLPHALATAVQYFEGHSQVDIASGHAIIINEMGDKLRVCYSDRFSLFRCAYRAVVLMQPSTFFRRTAFIRTSGFNSDNRSNWDGELFVDMALAGARFALVPTFLAAYRVHGESITGSGRLEELISLHGENMFRKIMGRERHRHDLLLAQVLRLMKHLLEPRNLYQRLANGPIYRRARARA
jgi:glycosyltransferase involved in cell wall biosynthesis